MISAIETKYGIDFVDSDFISTTPMDNLYMWLSKEKGKAGGGQNNSKVLGTWTRSFGDNVVAIQSNGTDLIYNLGTEQSFDSTWYDFEMELTITPSTGYTGVKYDIEFYKDGVLSSTRANNTGTTTHSFGGQPQDFEDVVMRFVIKTSEVFNFTPTCRS